jgi:hypothetical protein
MLAGFVFMNGVGDMLAYVDGGTGSLIFQVAIGGALSAVYFVSTQWRKLKGWMTGRQSKTLDS